jgi:hypothetical protein
MSGTVKLRRMASDQTATIAVDGTTSSVIVLDGFAIGMVFLPSTFDGTTVTFTCCATYGGTYVPYEDASSALVTITTAASQCFALPEGLFGAPYCKLVAGSTQTTTSTVATVTLKG